MELKVPGIDKLLEHVAIGVGAIAGPMLAPWRARREATAKRIHAEADADVRIIQAKAEATAMQINAGAQAEARELLLSGKDQMHGDAELSSDLITQKIEFLERKRISNVKAVVSHSAEQLADVEVDNRPPDADWTARFFDCVQDVSSEDMQRLWAKLLSGEVKRPGSVSLRTMDVVRNMTTADAKLFQSLCSFVLLERTGFGIVFRQFENEEDIQDIPFIELAHVKLLRHQDCGLLEIGSSRYRFTVSNHLISSGHVFRVKGIGDKKIPLTVSTLTAVGIQLYRISEARTNEVYLMTLARQLRKIDSDCELLYAPIIRRLADGSVEHETPFRPVLD